MQTHTPSIIFHGPVAEHDHACPVLWSEPSVYNYTTGCFDPSWKAQEMGWRLVRARNWAQRLLLRIAFGTPE